MKREDILDALEYIDEDLIREADHLRGEDKPAADTDKIIRHRRKPIPAARWGSLAAGFAVLFIALAGLAGILGVRTGNHSAGQNMETTEATAEEMKAEAAEPTEANPEDAEAKEMNPETAEPQEMLSAAAGKDAAEGPAMQEFAAEEDTAGETFSEIENTGRTENMAAAADAAEESVEIRVVSDAGEVVFALNDTSAARSLAGQLPLRAETELYGENEIVFHPEKPLDTENSTEGGGTAGYLGYFAPWDNIVMYYGDFEEYPGLYILGEAVSGAEYIKDIRGEILVESCG